MAAASPRAMRFVTRRLWDEDPAVARSSAAALAMVAATDAARGRELLRRFLWALNDESATNAGPVLEAVAALAAHTPELVRPYAGALVPLLADPGLAGGVVTVFERLLAAVPAAVEEFREELCKAMSVLPADLARRVGVALDGEEAGCPKA